MNRYDWAIEDLFESSDEWEKAYSDTEKRLDFSQYKGRLSDKKVFLEFMKKQEDVSRVIEKLGLYAHMLHDGDTRKSEYDALFSKSINLSVKFSSALSFVLPELTSLDENVIKDFISDKSLSDYDYMLNGILKEKEHVLSENEEKLLTESVEALSCFKDIFTKIDNADLPLKQIKHKNQLLPLSHGRYGLYMRSEDRELRKKCFKAYYASFISLINTISATYIGNVKKDAFFAKTKKYSSSLERALASEDVKSNVYYNLLKFVDKALPSLHKYVATKKKFLGLKQMHMYDLYVPTVKDADIKLEYDEAYKLVVEGLKPLGEEYGSLLKKAYDERWISVYETEGKRSGAYSTGIYDSHPYVLLNYQKTTHDVFTIAHEMGHSIHTYFSNRTQPYAKADYKIFVAEVASTVNEVLLIKHLLKTAKDKNLKKFLLEYLLEMIRTTLFRQTQFAEFEEFSHSTLESGQALTKDSMCAKYLELNKKYYGKSIISDDEIMYEWARIPHFYNAFYVYKYSTGIISALSIAERILSEGESAVKDYFEFLSSGGKDSPVELLKLAGVDLETDKPFKSAFRTFDDALNEYKSL